MTWCTRVHLSTFGNLVKYAVKEQLVVSSINIRWQAASIQITDSSPALLLHQKKNDLIYSTATTTAISSAATWPQQEASFLEEQKEEKGKRKEQLIWVQSSIDRYLWRRRTLLVDGTSKKVCVTVEQKKKATYSWKRGKQCKKEHFVFAVTRVSERVNIIEIDAWIQYFRKTNDASFPDRVAWLLCWKSAHVPSWTCDEAGANARTKIRWRILDTTNQHPHDQLFVPARPVHFLLFLQRKKRFRQSRTDNGRYSTRKSLLYFSLASPSTYLTCRCSRYRKGRPRLLGSSNWRFLCVSQQKGLLTPTIDLPW